MSGRRAPACTQSLAVSTARAEGAHAVATKFAAIMGDPRVRGREGAAFSLANLAPHLSSSEVGEIIAALEAQTQRSKVTPLDERMSEAGAGDPLAQTFESAFVETDFVMRMKARHGVTEQTGQIR